LEEDQQTEANLNQELVKVMDLEEINSIVLRVGYNNQGYNIQETVFGRQAVAAALQL
jgi:hypothetical protein